jgi:7-carboxy-7-deazaguanine synthase
MNTEYNTGAGITVRGIGSSSNIGSPYTVLIHHTSSTTSESNPTLDVNEIFYSLQGEGGRAGEPSLFIRLQGCKAQHACYASGVRCDTEFTSGKAMTVEEIYAALQKITTRCTWIVWTGGEPTDQLTTSIVEYFALQGYSQAIETSGLNPVPEGIDYIALSPKVAEHVIRKNFPSGNINELRYVRRPGQQIPRPSVIADHYYLSPHHEGETLNAASLQHCIQLCLDNPVWRLSVQQHKLWSVR